MDEALPEAFTIHTINILRVAAGMQQKAMAALLELEQEILGKLATAPTLNTRARLEAVLVQTNRSIGKSYEALAKTQIADLKDVAKLEARATVGIINDVIGADVLTVAIPEKLLEAVVDEPIILGNSSKEWWEAQDSHLRGKFRQQMQHGQLLGETNDQLIKRVRGTRAAGYTDGIMSTSRRNAAAIVRSSAISTSNAARIKTIESMPAVTKGIQWISTLDGKTSLICRALSGLAWTLPDYAPIGHGKAYPGNTAHWNCRSSQIPVLKSWEELSGKKLKDPQGKRNGKTFEERVKEKLAAKGMSKAQIDQATVNSRASMDGQVSKDLTMSDWLAKKDDDFINSTLGPKRAALWKRGKGQVALTDMTDQHNRPLTVKQLRAKYVDGAELPETAGLNVMDLDGEGQAK